MKNIIHLQVVTKSYVKLKLFFYKISFKKTCWKSLLYMKARTMLETILSSKVLAEKLLHDTFV